MNILIRILLLPLCLVHVACTQNMHGSFTPSSYRSNQGPATLLGAVEGRSCQTKALYSFPLGERATTDRAVKDAMSRIENTEFLTDMSIDDELYFGIGYSRQCIVVAATAYGPGD